MREPRQSGFLLSVLDGCFADVPLRHQYPFHDVNMPGSRHCLVSVLCEHPIAVVFMDLRLEWLVIAAVDRLNLASASRGDEINLDAKGLNGVNDGSHLVDCQRVQPIKKENLI